MFLSDFNQDKIVMVAEGKSKLITCKGEDVHWHKTETESDPPQHPGDAENNLMFEAITLDDAGTYVCKNSSNSVIETIEVKVTPGKNWLLAC